MIGNFPVGGRLCLFLPAWQWLTSDQFVLEVIWQDYSIPFVSLPPLSRIPVETSLPHLPLKREVLWEEVASLLTKGVVETVELSQDGRGGVLLLLSGYQAHFWVPPHPQPSWTQHASSCFARRPSVLLFRILLLAWWMVSLDLKDAYLHVPIHLSHWHFLRFALMNAAGELIAYHWKVLPLGLATAPRVFTKILAPVAAHWYMQGCLIYPYVNEIFHAQGSILQACHTRNVSLCCRFMLGFIVNLVKSALVPSQVMLHLGAMINTAGGSYSPLCQARDDQAHSSGTGVSYSGVSWIPSSWDRPSGILPFLSSAVHVSSPASADPS